MPAGHELRGLEAIELAIFGAENNRVCEAWRSALQHGEAERPPVLVAGKWEHALNLAGAKYFEPARVGSRLERQPASVLLELGHGGACGSNRLDGPIAQIESLGELAVVVGLPVVASIRRAAEQQLVVFAVGLDVDAIDRLCFADELMAEVAIGRRPDVNLAQGVGAGHPLAIGTQGTGSHVVAMIVQLQRIWLVDRPNTAPITRFGLLPADAAGHETIGVKEKIQCKGMGGSFVGPGVGIGECFFQRLQIGGVFACRS